MLIPVRLSNCCQTENQSPFWSWHRAVVVTFVLTARSGCLTIPIDRWFRRKQFLSGKDTEKAAPVWLTEILQNRWHALQYVVPGTEVSFKPHWRLHWTKITRLLSVRPNVVFWSKFVETRPTEVADRPKVIHPRGQQREGNVHQNDWDNWLNWSLKVRKFMPKKTEHLYFCSVASTAKRDPRTNTRSVTSDRDSDLWSIVIQTKKDSMVLRVKVDDFKKRERGIVVRITCWERKTILRGSVLIER